MAYKYLVWFILVEGLLIAGLILFMGKLYKDEQIDKLPYCVVDIKELANAYAFSASFSGRKLTENEVVVHLKRTLLNPHAYGCKAIFQKGAILSDSIDITNKVKNLLISEK